MFSKIGKLLLLALPLSISALDGQENFELNTANDCQSPGQCTPPDLPFRRVMNVPSRVQWWTNGGYCGSVSIQSITLSYGAYISQALVRKAAPDGGGHGDPNNGYEILHTNIQPALTNLKITYNAWGWDTQEVPQSDNYLSWLKGSLVKGNPVVWFIMCSGDKHNTYGVAKYDHVEPVYGIYSSSPLSDPTVYPDDVLVHGSDWDTNGYYRSFSTLVDSPDNGNKLTGNCSKAVAEGGGPNEAYPCLMNDKDYGYAITGLLDPLARSIPLSLSIQGDNGAEPQLTPVQLQATVRVLADNLQADNTYTIYRYDGTDSVPTDSSFDTGNFTNKFSFTVAEPLTDFIWNDPTPISSNTAVYYFALKSSDSNINTTDIDDKSDNGQVIPPIVNNDTDSDINNSNIPDAKENESTMTPPIPSPSPSPSPSVPSSSGSIINPTSPSASIPSGSSSSSHPTSSVGSVLGSSVTPSNSDNGFYHFLSVTMWSNPTAILLSVFVIILVLSIFISIVTWLCKRSSRKYNLVQHVLQKFDEPLPEL